MHSAVIDELELLEVDGQLAQGTMRHAHRDISGVLNLTRSQIYNFWLPQVAKLAFRNANLATLGNRGPKIDQKAIKIYINSSRAAGGRRRAEEPLFIVFHTFG